MMKILFINNTKDFPGSAISLLNLFSGLKARDVDIVLVGPKMESQLFLDKLQELNIRYITINNHKNIWPKIRRGSFFQVFYSYFQWPAKMIRLLYHIVYAERRLYDIINSFQPDIIHSNSGVIHEGIVCAKKRHIPHVIHLREYQDIDFGMKFFPSKRHFVNLLHQSYVITITEDILNHFDLGNYEKAKVIYNGIYPKNRITKVWPKKKFFICCSRISESKGHEDVIKAFAKFAAYCSDYRLKILGYGSEDYILKLKVISSELGCDKNIDWVGFVSDPFNMISESRALIVASRAEGFGRMTAEAAFAGTVVVGRNSGGTKEILKKTGGILFNTVDELEAGMQKVASMTLPEYDSIIENAQSFAVNNYSNEANVENIYNLYNCILKS